MPPSEITDILSLLLMTTRGIVKCFIKQKSEVFEKFKEYHAKVTNMTGKKLKRLRSDNGGEYLSAKFQEYLKAHGTKHEVTTPYTPQQNGVSERLNRTLQEMALSQLLHASLPKHFWADSVSTACFVRNRLPVCPPVSYTHLTLPTNREV